jgi:hypothetical protein
MELTKGQKTAKTNKERYGENYYQFIGRLGGKAKKKEEPKKILGLFSFRKNK